MLRRSPNPTPTSMQSLLVKQFQDLNINIYGTYEDPLFKAKDIGELLEMSNIRETIKTFNDKQKVVSLTDTLGGKQKTTMLTEQGLYKVLMKSRKKIAEEFQDWVCEVIEEIRKKGKYDLEEKLKLKDQALIEKDQELKYYKELTYEEVEKIGHNYILSTDKPGVYKEGLAKDTKKRVKGLQTGNVDDIQILFEYPTSNPALLENIVHFVLDRYRCNSNREHFRCNLDYMKTIIQLAGKMIDTLKSSYQTITKEELLEHLAMDIYLDDNIEEEIIEQVKNENNDFFNWLDENIIYKENSILRLTDLCESYLGKKVPSRSSTKYRKDFEKYIKENFHNIKYDFQNSTFNNEKYRGWLNLSFI